jgi:hypothetical protein
MIFDELSRVSVMCTACSKLNAVLATQVRDESPVGCSKCGATIGLWGDLKHKQPVGVRLAASETGSGR